MGKQNKQGISWTDETWNPMIGCSKVSPGCDNCWAAKAAWLHYHHAWDGNIRLFPERLQQPLHWRKPRKIAVCLMGDLFHENVPNEFILKVFETMAYAKQHTFQILTKRPKRMNYLLAYREDGLRCDSAEHHRLLCTMPLPNVHLGVSCENQAAADERIPLLLQTPAAVRFVSAEPLLSPIDFEKVPLPDGYFQWAGVTGCLQPLSDIKTESDDYRYFQRKAFKLDWVIVGGESGPGARPMHPDWVRSTRDQCQLAHVPFHFKQRGEWSWGEDDGPPRGSTHIIFHEGVWTPKNQIGDFASVRTKPYAIARVGKKAAGRILDGREWLEFPGGE
jgi:protein gp37